MDNKEIQPVHLKGNQPWVFIGKTDVETETPILWPPQRRADSLEKTLMLTNQMTSTWGAIGLLSRNFLAVLMIIQHLIQLCRAPGPVEERDPVTIQGDQRCDHQGWGHKASVTALER